MKCILMSALLLTTVTTGAMAQEQRPNVVIMLGDNVGYGDIGAYGAGEIRGMPTPRIDQLASESLRLTQYLVEPACSPSRAALLTGRYSVRSGLNGVIIGGTPNTLQAGEVTLAELFKTKGYATAIAGKWHLGADEQSWPTRQGFDEYHVGVLESTDGTLYRESMQRQGMPEQAIVGAEPSVWESEPDGTLKKVRPYTLEYRKQVEGDIAKASVDFIDRASKGNEPFFLYVGWTHTHYPTRTAPEFEGKSRIGIYGDAVMELDFRTGQVLDAIKAAGIEQNTIVIWLSDNAAAPTAGPFDTRYGFNGPFREMVSVHDFLPTLASIIDAEVPTDRPIDGVDQSAFFTGAQEKSNRESLITFVADEVAGVRWRSFRLYPKQFVMAGGNPSMNGLAGNRMEMNGFPAIYNIEADPREEVNVVGTAAWVVGPYLRVIGDYQKSLVDHPNPKGFSLTEFGK
ncbi:sulfatase-like hydrolase/transferase [Mesorhizobium ventifaucium]|uniref:Arylsulfatase n=1 Tax=Mesorhizobium ventifaucium TaxID=666020 RepID=A0ABN8JW90_9HYPH|nr:sulfatase-like hydrolase/transferase [Mesorhizobium ventifaucium]CAH2401851.1 Arylsulfatase [Mesorhizobium ventifaucium]